MVSRATPDGNTFILCNQSSTILAKLTYTKLPYDPQKDIVPISLVCTFQHALAVTPSLPVSDTVEFAAWARANPNRANLGVPAVGGPSHFFGLMLGRVIGVDIQIVPYKGTAAMVTDLSSGQLDVGISAVADFVAPHKGGRLRIIATSGKERALSTPELPTFAQSGFPALAGEGWYGLYAPARTPPTTVAALSAEVQAIMNLPDIRERLLVLSLDPRGSTPAQLAEFDANELSRWRPVVAESGFKVE
jgi:tripartite-type tricarboxylate transporter receptor subunit TctC